METTKECCGTKSMREPTKVVKSCKWRQARYDSIDADIMRKKSE